MMQALDMASLAERHGWRLVGRSHQFDRVCTDSRELHAGDFYVALKGEHFDGHDFVKQAAGAGATGALVEREIADDLPQLVCFDTLQALATIAAENRGRFKGDMVALTGSAGKTTTREMLATILATQGAVLATQGNLNNEVGMPLTLLQLAPRHDYAVIEMGAAKRGDIRYLADIARPDIGLVTNAREAHLDGFGDLQTIAETKGELFAGLAGYQCAVINADDEYRDLWQSMAAPARVVTFGIDNPAAQVRAEQIEMQPLASRFRIVAAHGDIQVELPVGGRHMVENALAAAACAVALSIPLPTVAGGLADFEPVAGRMQPLVGNFGGKLFDDSYNANPSSVRAAIDVLAAQDGQAVLILGDMAELGPQTAALHRAMGEYARRQGIRHLWGTGRLSQVTVDGFGAGGEWFATRDALLEHAVRALSADDVVLVKGSRSARMDEVVAGLRADAVTG
jgi:UDP-N-acetylmuramoyl-tripeptide--D-alanyl-D-alanine ligase